jgi:hypothetical protein
MKSRVLVDSQSVSRRVAIAEAWGQLRNPKERGHPLLEAVTRRLVKTKQDEKTRECALECVEQ